MNNTAFRVIQSPQPGYVYLISAVGTGKFKIGKTSTSVESRIAQLQTGCPIKIRYVYHAFVEDINKAEKDLHLAFKQFRKIGEWFTLQLDDIKECITLMRLVQIDETAFLLPQQKDEELDDLPKCVEAAEREIEITCFTASNLSRQVAKDLIEKLKNDAKLNQTEIIQSLWECKKGGSKAWTEAYAQYKELMGE
ncbi:MULTISPECIES: GIY-YIG nuclease family protein [unclassified Microcoleus]|uniref:GIY-YIG nuclease family protein n=1 Tax=unclassified Microcoleus TaxID=2642155 RepID=UPI002FD4BE5A